MKEVTNMMTWEVYRCDYLYDDDYDVRGISDPICLGEFNHFSPALECFQNLLNHRDGIAKAFLKVFDHEHPDGDIMMAFSMEWEDDIFNNDAV
jgi:hypothetical protein